MSCIFFIFLFLGQQYSRTHSISREKRDTITKRRNEWKRESSSHTNDTRRQGANLANECQPGTKKQARGRSESKVCLCSLFGLPFSCPAPSVSEIAWRYASPQIISPKIPSDGWRVVWGGRGEGRGQGSWRMFLSTPSKSDGDRLGNPSPLAPMFLLEPGSV